MCIAPDLYSLFEGITVFVTVRATCRSSPEKDEGMRSGCMEREVVTLCV